VDERKNLSQHEPLISASRWNCLNAFTEKKLHNLFPSP
jgi:hypothetical protein